MGTSVPSLPGGSLDRDLVGAWKSESFFSSGDFSSTTISYLAFSPDGQTLTRDSDLVAGGSNFSFIDLNNHGQQGWAASGNWSTITKIQDPNEPFTGQIIGNQKFLYEFNSQTGEWAPSLRYFIEGDNLLFTNLNTNSQKLWQRISEYYTGPISTPEAPQEGRQQDVISDQLSSNEESANSDEGRQIYRLTPNDFGNRKSADRITEFNFLTDSIELPKEFFPGLKNTKLGTIKGETGRKILKTGKSSTQPLYKPASGELFFNQNRKERGFGDGGLFAILEGGPPLFGSSFDIV